jgi:hypothetical protein
MARNLLRWLPTEDACLDGVKHHSATDRTMATEQSIPQTATSTDRARDLHSKLYRKIGISAVVAALEATKPMRNRKDFSSALRDVEAV